MQLQELTEVLSLKIFEKYLTNKKFLPRYPVRRIVSRGMIRKIEGNENYNQNGNTRFHILKMF